MSDNIKRWIRNNYVELCSNMQADGLLGYLLQYGVLTDIEKDKVEAGKTSLDRNNELLRIVELKGKEKYLSFKMSIRESEQEYLLENLEKSERNLAGDNTAPSTTKEGTSRDFRKKITGSYHQLKTSMIVKELLPHLYQDEVITRDQYDGILEEKIAARQNDILLNITKKGDRRSYSKWISALRKTGQNHLADSVEGSGARATATDIPPDLLQDMQKMSLSKPLNKPESTTKYPDQHGDDVYNPRSEASATMVVQQKPSVNTFNSYAKLQADVDKVLQLLVADLAAHKYTHKYELGRPLRVAVFDSGCFTNHQTFTHHREKQPGPSLGDGFEWCGSILQKSYVPMNDDMTIDDKRNHGTAVCGIIAGGAYIDQDEIIRRCGVAPFVDLLICKVIDQHGNVPVQSVVNALRDLDRLDEQGLNVEVVNMSLGFFEFVSDAEKTALQQAISEASLKRVVVSASSNDGEMNYETIAYPARFDSCISVGSHKELGNRSTHSAIGPQLNFLAPGEIVAGASSNPDIHPRGLNVVEAKNGTSFAAPHISGFVAQVLVLAELAGNEDMPGSGPALRGELAKTDNMRNFLMIFSTGRTHHTNDRGYGLIKLHEIHDLVTRSPNRFVQLIQDACKGKRH